MGDRNICFAPYPKNGETDFQLLWKFIPQPYLINQESFVTWCDVDRPISVKLLRMCLLFRLYKMLVNCCMH
uniref:Uncharacterized protein n=1 Tax=Chelonoidis abingdonii TaxID=106734 RepID=A0A8C0G0M8_CHEAB